MQDIVERLREHNAAYYARTLIKQTMHEAADEIERLRARIRSAENELMLSDRWGLYLHKGSAGHEF